MDNPFQTQDEAVCLNGVVWLVGVIKGIVERKRLDFFDELYSQTGRGSLLPGETMEIPLPSELAEAWIMLEGKPLNELTLCSIFKGKERWSNVWMEERRTPNGDKNLIIIFRA